MRYSKLLENLDSKNLKETSFRRYSLSEIISESYKSLYNSERGTNLQKLAEAHLEDVRRNPADVDRLSRQLCKIKALISMVESKEIKDEELLVPEEKYDTVEPKEKEEIKESAHDEEVEEKDDENLLDESAHDEEVEEKEDNDLLEDTELTDEEVEELTKHLTEIRKNKKVEESSKKEEKEELKEDVENPVNESKSWENISLKEFAKKSSSKAFVKTFKKLDAKLHEGTALTRQESISLYKAANSAMTHLSVELEHNPEFLPVFTESVTLLSADVSKLLESMKNDKAPSKATMKSLAKFSEAILREDDEEELPPIEDEEENIVSEEDVEQFDQEYAEARVELHKELADEHADDENPEVEERLEQDAEEIVNLPGVTDEQIAEIQGEEAPVESEEEIPAEAEEEIPEEEIEEKEELSLEDDDITDDELAELKKHLTEMRKAKYIKESKGRRLMRRN